MYFLFSYHCFVSFYCSVIKKERSFASYKPSLFCTWLPFHTWKLELPKWTVYLLECCCQASQLRSTHQSPYSAQLHTCWHMMCSHILLVYVLGYISTLHSPIKVMHPGIPSLHNITFLQMQTVLLFSLVIQFTLIVRKRKNII